jgi:poly-gamma-glutamate synthesis protein (capsule biosynthesis protein)
MSNQNYDEFQRDEEMLEARRLKRLEMKRKRKIQQRIIIGALALILILVVALIVKGCSDSNTPDNPDDEIIDQQEPDVPEVPDEPVDPPKPDTKVTISAVGDIMIYDELIADAKQDDGTYNFEDCFKAISGFTSQANFTVGNLELNFLGGPDYKGKATWNAPEVLAENLKSIGFDILQTANTYSINNGINGLTNTIKFLKAAGIDPLGTYIDKAEKADGGGVLIKEMNGIKIAFVAFTKGCNGYTLPTGSEYCVDLLYTDYNKNYSNINQTAIQERLDAAKRQQPDVIVAMLHWGAEYETETSASQEEITNLMLKNGVDVILGSHSHVVGPMETRTVETVDGETKECFVAYSLGNFFSYMSKDHTMVSTILNLEFTKNGETGKTTISKADYLPVYILDRGAEADTRFEVLPIRAAIESTLFEEYKNEMLDAIDTLKTNTASEFDSGK